MNVTESAIMIDAQTTRIARIFDLAARDWIHTRLLAHDTRIHTEKV